MVRRHFTKLFLLLFYPYMCVAAEATLTNVHVERKPGHEAGEVHVTVAGKDHRLSRNAFEAWAVEGSTNVLLLLPSNEKKNPRAYRLRYYDMDLAQGRTLGTVPFTRAEITETKLADGSWAIALVGFDASHTPTLVVTDTEAVRAQLDHATTPQFQQGNLVYRNDNSAEQQKIAIESILGRDLPNIYRVNSADYVQFLRNGKAVSVKNDKSIKTGIWLTNGALVQATYTDGSKDSFPRATLTEVSGVPAGTRAPIRLLQPLSSHTAKEGTAIEAVLIQPIVVKDRILIPQGSKFHGTITAAHGVGWGIKHETAALTIDFNRIDFGQGRSLDIHSILHQVENSQENVTEKGKIQGIRSTGTLGHSAESRVASVAQADPIAYLFASSAATAILGFAEPEIMYPAGTELAVDFTAPLITEQVYKPQVEPLTDSDEERQKLYNMVRALPFRTTTQGSNKVSDITNLVFIGSEQSLQRAFKAAGWIPADDLTAQSTFQTMKSISGNQTYNQGPMSTLLLDERPPIFTLTKTTNTFSSRHHLRVFNPNNRFENQTVLTSSSTQDIGIAFSKKKKTFIHVIDQYIDNERAKVVSDLEFTGCVDAIDMVPRPWVPTDAYNSTGDRLRTDGAIAVMRVNDCAKPQTTPSGMADRPNRAERIGRDTILFLRNDVYRGNLVYQGITGGMTLHRFLTKESDLPTDGAWRTTDALGNQYEGYGNMPLERQSSITAVHLQDEEAAKAREDALPAPDHRWDPPRYEIAINGGFLHYRSKELETVSITATPINPALPSYFTDLYDDLDDGWAAGLSVTLNTWRWVSNEFAYTHQHGKYRLNFSQFSDSLDDEGFVDNSNKVGLVTRQFEYNVLIHARPRESRWRPYIALGPTLQLISLADSPLKRAAGPYRLGLSNIGLFQAAFDFGRTPPLDGGGVFQVGLQYGGGIKFRVHPRITLRADFRETWGKNPSIIGDSYEDYATDFSSTEYETDVIKRRPPGKFFQQRFTIGVAYTF